MVAGMAGGAGRDGFEGPGGGPRAPSDSVIPGAGARGRPGAEGRDDPTPGAWPLPLESDLGAPCLVAALFGSRIRFMSTGGREGRSAEAGGRICLPFDVGFEGGWGRLDDSGLLWLTWPTVGWPVRGTRG